MKRQRVLNLVISPRVVNQLTNCAKIVFAVVIVVAMSLASPAIAQKGKGKPGGGGSTGYQVRQLDTGEGMATDIYQDEFVEVVGISYADATAVYWMLDADGEVLLSMNLNTGVGQTSGALGLNRQGAIVGWHYTAGVDNSARPLVWSDFTSDPVQLPVPAGFQGVAQATDINDSLIVVGNLVADVGQHSIVAWQLAEVDGVLVSRDANTVATGAQSGQPHVNHQGYLAATLDNRACRWRVVWNPSLGESGGLEVVSSEILFDILSYAADINESGTVCGEVAAFGGGHAAYAINGSLLDLPLLDVNNRKHRTTNVAATAINNAG